MSSHTDCPLTWFWPTCLYSGKAEDIQESVEYKGRLTISGEAYDADSMPSEAERDWGTGGTCTGEIGGGNCVFGLRRRLLNRPGSI